jgi:hypothetical protein
MIRTFPKQVIGNFALNPFPGKFFRPKPPGSLCIRRVSVDLGLPWPAPPSEIRS